MDPGTSAHDRVLRLRIELIGVTPTIWREIEVPADYDFWSLHVAIQDAMEWRDAHLHHFVLDPRSGESASLVIGLPDPGAPDSGPRPGWEYPIGPFVHPGTPAIGYLYDFDDRWEHRVACVGSRAEAPSGDTLPRCVAGERACPPEGCGGPSGYARLLAALAEPPGELSPGDADLLERLPPGFDPQRFDPAQVEFDDPQVRLDVLLDSDDAVWKERQHGEDEEVLGFAPGRFDAHSLSEQLIDQTWVETAELRPRQALETYDEVARQQPHLLAFVLDETEILSEEARSLAHFLFVTVLRMFRKAAGTKLREIPRSRIDQVRERLEELETDALSDSELTLLGIDGELSRQPILNELLADILSNDGPDTAAEGIDEDERDVLFDRLRVIVEVLDGELRG